MTQHLLSTAHPLTDEMIDRDWPDAATEDGRALIRTQFDALLRQLRLVWHRSFPRHHELFATITAERAASLPERVSVLKKALLGLPEHWHQWQWKADDRAVFGERAVRSVYGDNGHGMGRQVVAAVPADKHYFGTVADFIAAANPDTIAIILARLDELEASHGVLATDHPFTIYTASKTGHAHRWRELREQGWPVIATWIDEAGIGETDCFTDLWTRCVGEASRASAVLLYREPGEILKGAFVEAGAALANGKPVHAIGCAEFSFVNHPLVSQHPTLEAALAVLTPTEGE